MLFILFRLRIDPIISENADAHIKYNNIFSAELKYFLRSIPITRGTIPKSVDIFNRREISTFK
jgi:hypothetical protein